MALTVEEYEGAFDAKQDLEFEPVPGNELSPINEPVKEGEVSEGVVNTDKPSAPQEDLVESAETSEAENDVVVDAFANVEERQEPRLSQEPLDAPEQEVDAADEEDGDLENNSGNQSGIGADLNIPTEHSGLIADSLLGMSSDYLEIGAGFFVKIKKDKSFYEFEEVIERIDHQNEKNIKRFRLDPEDRALLRPLLIHVMKQRAKQLTPEQQLIAAVLTILIKKSKMAFEIKAENRQLFEHLKTAIKEAKAFSNSEETTDQSISDDEDSDGQQKEAA